MPLTPIPPTPAVVPRAPGIPTMPAGTTVTAAAAALVGNIGLIRSILSGPQWGIFSEAGQPVIVGDSVRSMEYRRPQAVSDFQQIYGAFASYNKVQLPREIRLIFMSSGAGGILSGFIPGLAAFGGIAGTSVQSLRRHALLKLLEDISESTTLYRVMTPDYSYSGMTIINHNYHRMQQDGSASNIPLEVWLREVRQVYSENTTQTVLPAAQSPASIGPVEPTMPNPAQAAFGGPLDGGGA